MRSIEELQDVMANSDEVLHVTFEEYTAYLRPDSVGYGRGTLNQDNIFHNFFDPVHHIPTLETGKVGFLAGKTVMVRPLPTTPGWYKLPVRTDRCADV